MRAPVVVLVHSPFVGPMTWQPVAGVLRDRGEVAVTPSLVGALQAGPPFYDGVAALVREWLEGLDDPALLVVHSGAGPLVPSIVEGVPEGVSAVVFVDASLPHPGQAWCEAVPAEMVEQLRRLTVDGVLPPWHEWFPAELLAQLLPDDAARAAFIAEVPRLPVTYLEERAPVASGWLDIPCGYLRLSQPYDRAAAQAEERGWPVIRHGSNHLGPFTEPTTIVELLDALRTRLGHPPRA